jgi:hypothetical protein
MMTPSPTPEVPATPAAVFASLLQNLEAAGRKPEGPNVTPATPEALAAALFDVAGRTGAAMFSVWAEEDAPASVDEDEEGGGGEAPGEPVLNAGISLFFIEKEGAERVPVRQPMAYALYGPLGQALAAHAKRGADSLMPDRGAVSFPVGAADPEVEFRVSFRDTPLGTWTTALARDRETREAFPGVDRLALPAEQAAYLKKLFNRLEQALFRGQLVLLTGASGTGRSTTMRSLIDALPDNVHALAAVEEPKGGAGAVAVGMVKVTSERSLVQVVRSFLRQDPDLVFADEVRTVEDMTMLCNAALTGHATVCVLEAKTPEEGYAWLKEALPVAPMQALIVHHTRDAAGTFAMRLHETKPAEDGQSLRLVAWSAAA